MGTGVHLRTPKGQTAGPTEWWNICIYLSVSVIVCSVCEFYLCIISLFAFSIDTLAPVNSATWTVDLCLIKFHAVIALTFRNLASYI